MIKKIITGIVVIIASLVLVYHFLISPRYVVPILTYHHIEQKAEDCPSVTLKSFSTEMKFLKKHRYNIISLDALVTGITQHKKFPHNTVVITFDDGYKDNYLYAFPVLHKYGFPATIFLATKYVDENDPLFLSWDEIGIMAENKITFGAHTHSHVYIPDITDMRTLTYEIKKPKELIESHLNMPCFYFCYPVGGFTKTVKELLQKNGYKGACTTNRGHDKFNHDVYELNRIKITDKDSRHLFFFWAKLTGYYTIFKSLKASH